MDQFKNIRRLSLTTYSRACLTADGGVRQFEIWMRHNKSELRWKYHLPRGGDREKYRTGEMT
jgi:hypothetical protein